MSALGHYDYLRTKLPPGKPKPETAPRRKPAGRGVEKTPFREGSKAASIWQLYDAGLDDHAVARMMGIPVEQARHIRHKATNPNIRQSQRAYEARKKLERLAAETPEQKAARLERYRRYGRNYRRAQAIPPKVTPQQLAQRQRELVEAKRHPLDF